MQDPEESPCSRQPFEVLLSPVQIPSFLDDRSVSATQEHSKQRQEKGVIVHTNTVSRRPERQFHHMYQILCLARLPWVGNHEQVES